MYIVTLDGKYLHHPNLDLHIFDAKVSLEVNRTGAFDFKIYPSNPLYSTIQRFKSIIEVYDDNVLIFRGRPLNDTVDMDKAQTIECEGELAYLNDSQMIPYEYTGSISGLLSLYINNHNSQVETSKQFTLGTVNVTDPNDTIVRSNINYSKTWKELNDKLIDLLGGYLVLRRENNINYLDYIADSPYESGQSVEVSKNILNYQQSIKVDEIATVLIPLGAKLKDEEGKDTDVRLDVSSVNNGKAYIEHTQGINQYGRIWSTVVFDDVEVPLNLLSKGTSLLNTMVNLGVNISIKAVDLNMVDGAIPKIRFFNYIRVKSEFHGIDERMLITKQTIDLSNPAQNTIDVGISYETFTQKQLQRDNVIGIIQNEYITNDQVTQILNPVSVQVSQILQTYQQIQSTVASINTTYQEIVDSPITAYEIAVANGFNGTQEEWIESLKGADGTSVKILGTKAQESELPLSNNLAGDGYIIDGDLWVWTGTAWTNVGRIQGQNGKDGIGYQLILSGDDGLVFDSTTDTVSRNLRAKVYINNTDVTETLPNTYFTWTRKSNYPSIDNEFNAQGIQNKVLTLTSYYLQTNATYICTLTIPSVSGYLLDNNDNALTDANGNKIVVTSHSLTFQQQITIVKDVQPQITTLRSDITQLAGEISLKVNQTTVDQLTSRVSTAESNITINQNQISSKVSTTDFTGANLVSMINQTPSSVQIMAKNIALEGLTTVNNSFTIGLDGSFSATAGTVGGWEIYPGFIRSVSGANNISIINHNDPSGYFLYTTNNSGNSQFSVSKLGVLKASGAEISGKITATSGTFTGRIEASSGYINNLSCTNLTIGGSSFSGSVSGTGYLSSGALGGNNFYRTASGFTQIDNLSTTALYCSGIANLGTSASGSNLAIYTQGTGRAYQWVNTSDIRYKKDFITIDDEFNDYIYSLPIGTYQMKDNDSGERAIGINANLVDETMPKEFTQYILGKDNDNYYYANYIALVPMLIKTVQSLNERVKELEGVE